MRFYGLSQSGKLFFEPVDNILPIESKHVAYIRIIDCYGAPKSYNDAWMRLREFGEKSSLLNKNTEWIGLCFDNPTITKPEKCRFYACFTTSESVKPMGAFGSHEIKGGLYAVFVLKEAYSGLMKLYRNIYIHWLPNSDYDLRNGESFELYLNSPSQVSEDEILTEVYLPIERKRKRVLRNA